MLNASNLKMYGFPDVMVNRYFAMLNGFEQYGLPFSTANLRKYYQVEGNVARGYKYLHSVATGEVPLETADDVAKHMKKICGSKRHLKLYDLEVSTLTEPLRCAVVVGIPEDSYFAIWNSDRYSDFKRKYFSVVGVRSDWLILTTFLRPILPKGANLKIEGVLEVLGTTKDKQVCFRVNRRYAKLCNSYIIVASLKRPEFHLGMVEMVTADGSKVYVFAKKELAGMRKLAYSNSSQRVYDTGLLAEEITPRVMRVGKYLYGKLGCVYSQMVEGTDEFTPLETSENRGYTIIG